jgi:hypothetical protein
MVSNTPTRSKLVKNQLAKLEEIKGALNTEKRSMILKN